jgi:hypothetical protein
MLGGKDSALLETTDTVALLVGSFDSKDSGNRVERINNDTHTQLLVSGETFINLNINSAIHTKSEPTNRWYAAIVSKNVKVVII